MTKNDVPSSVSRPEEEFEGLDQVNKYVTIFIDLSPPKVHCLNPSNFPGKYPLKTVYQTFN